MLEWIRFGVCAALTAFGILILFVSVFGLYRFKFALNRIHSAAMADTLALMMFAAALIVYEGFVPVSLKIVLVLLLQWFTSPVSSHMLVKFEYETDENLDKYCLTDRGDDNA